MQQSQIVSEDLEFPPAYPAERGRYWGTVAQSSEANFGPMCCPAQLIALTLIPLRFCTSGLGEYISHPLIILTPWPHGLRYTRDFARA